MAEAAYTNYRVLYEIAKEINSNLSVSSVLKAIVESTARAMGAMGCSLLLLNPDGKTMEHTVYYGLSGKHVGRGPIQMDQSTFETLQGKIVAIEKVMEDPRVRYKEVARQEGISSLLSVPFELSNRVVGILRIYTAEVRVFSQDDKDFLVAVSNLGALALERAQVCQGLDQDLRKALEARVKLEDQKRSFVRFISIVAHDLKAPLAAIQSYFGVMLGGFSGPLNEKQKNMIERSGQRIQELLALVSDLLDVSRIETGQIVQELKTVSFHDIVRKALEAIEGSAEQKHIVMKVDVSKEMPLIYASDIRLTQALVNLLSNSVKFTPEGGEVSVVARERNDDLLVEVCDTGVGIPLQDQSHLFEDFFRGSNTQEKGTGLGLSIVKRIVEAHGGKIWAESPRAETGTGTKLAFTLPKRAAPGVEARLARETGQ